MKKRVLSLMLTLSMVCAFIPVIATAATSNTWGKNLIWTFDDNGTLTITGTGDMYDGYKYRNYSWYNKCSEIKSIIIESGVTSIAREAFYGYHNLTSVTIPDSVISIGESAFCDCDNLDSVYITDLAAY